MRQLVHVQATSPEEVYNLIGRTPQTKGSTMKTIPVEQLDPQLTKALEQQDEHEAIGLTKDSGTVAWVLRVPEALKDKGADLVFYGGGPVGGFHIVVRAKRAFGVETDGAVTNQPVFGGGRGTLTIISDDDHHLKDFQEYMQ